jgi:class 3 adenylate cyclase
MADARIGTAAVMFTDLVGSTELRVRLGEDAAETVRAHHDRILTESIESHRGRVVKHLGDGIMASFVSCTDALAAAVAVQQAIDLGNRRPGGERLEVRIGLAVGDVTFDGDDCFGLAVIEAQRLESAAAPGSIWCTDTVAHLARGRGNLTFGSLGLLSLKGLADPVAASVVQWEPIRERSDPDPTLPTALAGSGFPFSGRSETFDRLLESWSSGAAGGFELVLLAGEPGVGKTRLAQELARRVRADAEALGQVAPLVLAGRCDEDGAPFQAFGTALEWFARQERPDPGALGAFPGDLDRLVPRLGDLVAGLPPRLRDEPDAERQRLFQAVESWLSVGGAGRPRLLVIDDLHWADRPTLLLLRHLVRHRPAGLVIVGTYRDTDVGRDHPLSSMLGEYRRTGEATRIEVQGLGPDGVRELLVRAGGHVLDGAGMEFADRVQRATSGNPFFLSEVLRELIENGTLVRRGGQWTSDLQADEAGIPAGVREVVGQRLHRLGEPVDRILRTAAVIGYEFDAELLAEVVSIDIEDVLDLLDTARSANLVLDVGADRHRFAHGLVRETLHAEMSSGRRSREHRKVALALEARHRDALDDVTPDLAAHWIEATVGGDRRRAIELSTRAGDLAAARGAHENAATWFGRALELMANDGRDRPLERQRLLVRLAEAEGVSGAATEARAHALEAARAAIDEHDPAMAVAALRVRARHSFSASDPADPERVDLLRDALSMSSLDAWQRAALLGELAKELIFERDLAGRRQALDERELLLGELPLLERVQLVATAGTTSYVCPARSALQRQADEARAVLDRTPDMSASERWRILGHLAYTALHLGDRAALDDAIDEMSSLDAGIGAVRTSMTGLHEVMRRVIDGQVSTAEQAADALVEQLEQLGVPEAGAYRSTTTLATARERGTMVDLVSAVDAIAAGAHPLGPERTTAAYVRVLRGDLELARAAMLGLDEHDFTDDATLQLCLAFWAEIVACLRNDEHCARFIETLGTASGVNLLIGGMYLGPVDRLLAMLHEARGDHDRADALFESAVAQQLALGSPPWVARTQVDWASACFVRGERERCAALLDAAEGTLGGLDLTDTRQRHAALAAQLAIGA